MAVELVKLAGLAGALALVRDDPEGLERLVAAAGRRRSLARSPSAASSRSKRRLGAEGAGTVWTAGNDLDLGLGREARDKLLGPVDLGVDRFELRAS